MHRRNSEAEAILAITSGWLPCKDEGIGGRHRQCRAWPRHCDGTTQGNGEIGRLALPHLLNDCGVDVGAGCRQSTDSDRARCRQPDIANNGKARRQGDLTALGGISLWLVVLQPFVSERLPSATSVDSIDAMRQDVTIMLTAVTCYILVLVGEPTAICVLRRAAMIDSPNFRSSHSVRTGAVPTTAMLATMRATIEAPVAGGVR